MADFNLSKKIKVQKNQSNIVTKVDIKSEKAIIKIIESKYPKHNIIAEETGYKNKGSEYTWVIDPIDGTSNYANNIPWFGTLIAVLKNNKPLMAGAVLPFYKNYYFAQKNKGCFLNNKKISVSKEKNLKNILVAYSLDYKENFKETKKATDILAKIVNNVRNIRSTNSLVDFLYTAEGKLGSCIFSTTKIWDVASPTLLIEEAGGKVTDIKGKKLNFKISEKDYQKNYTFVASNKALHSKIIKLLK